MSKYLGKGSYGQVVKKNNLAIKKFNKLSHLIQEYTALKYLNNCQYIVEIHSVNWSKLELAMNLYDYNLSQYLKKYSSTMTYDERDEIIKSILLGLIEIHDRNLIHSDLKPANILVNANPFKLVLGDCGFVSIAKYSKATCTTPIYQEPNTYADYAHDIYSFGMCFLKIYYDKSPYTFYKNKSLIAPFINTLSNEKHKRLLKSIFLNNRFSRPSAREILLYLYDINPSKSESYLISRYDISEKTKLYIETHDIRNKIIHIAKENTINRSKLGYGVFLILYNNDEISDEDVPIYISVILYILKSLFSDSSFSLSHILYTVRNFENICSCFYDSKYIVKNYILTSSFNHQILKTVNHILSNASCFEYLIQPEKNFKK